MRICKSLTMKNGRLCSSPPLKDEDFCLFHSVSERGKELRLKGIENRRKNRKLMFRPNGTYTTYGMCQCLISVKKKLLKDKKTTEKVRIPLLIRLDKAIMRWQEKLIEEERLKREERNYVPFHVRLKQAQEENLEGKKIS